MTGCLELANVFPVLPCQTAIDILLFLLPGGIPYHVLAAARATGGRSCLEPIYARKRLYFLPVVRPASTSAHTFSIPWLELTALQMPACPRRDKTMRFHTGSENRQVCEDVRTFRAVVLEHRHCLGVIALQTLHQCLRGVVGPLHQSLASFVVAHVLRGRSARAIVPVPANEEESNAEARLLSALLSYAAVRCHSGQRFQLPGMECMLTIWVVRT